MVVTGGPSTLIFQQDSAHPHTVMFTRRFLQNYFHGSPVFPDLMSKGNVQEDDRWKSGHLDHSPNNIHDFRERLHQAWDKVPKHTEYNFKYYV